MIQDYWLHQSALDFGKETAMGYYMQDNELCLCIAIGPFKWPCCLTKALVNSVKIDWLSQLHLLTLINVEILNPKLSPSCQC